MDKELFIFSHHEFLALLLQKKTCNLRKYHILLNNSHLYFLSDNVKLTHTVAPIPRGAGKIFNHDLNSIAQRGTAE